MVHKKEEVSCRIGFTVHAQYAHQLWGMMAVVHPTTTDETEHNIIFEKI